MTYIRVWVQIQNLPPFLTSKKVACSIIGATVGMVLIIDRLSVVSMSTMVRVRIDLAVCSVIWRQCLHVQAYA